MTAIIRRLLALGLLLGCAFHLPARAAEPLRVFIRGGIKTHGPNQHDHPRFLGEWTKLLGERGLKVDGAMEFPTAAQLALTDVLVIYAADGMKIEGQQRTDFETFLKRGGGVVVIHDGIVSGQGSENPEWTKKIVGGAWRWDLPPERRTKWHEGEVGLYWVDQEHPISRGISNFDWNDEIYYDLDMAPDARVLATSFHSVFVIAPQIWTYERTLEGGAAPYRAVVSLPGHMWDVFETPHYRAILLRSIAWAGRRADADEFVRPEELASLKYPAGGPTPAKKAQAELQERLHPEFTISLAADENVSEKIISLDWDPRGRLWVVETPEYPGGRDIHRADAPARPYRARDPERFPVGGREDRPPRDRISILEDTDGDGHFDRRTVWADQLELPTSLVFHRDGVIVAQAPDILWLRDTNGDGKADTREVLYTGWGTFDTHAVINNFRWAADGWVYGAVGYTRGNVSSPKTGKRFGEINAGLFRFRPDGSALEQVAAGSCNTWGCEVAPDGEIFYTTATCGEPLLHVVMPEKFLARASVGGTRASASIASENKIYPAIVHTRPPYVQIDWVGAWTAAAGSCWYDGGAWPAKWNNAFFYSEATMHIFHAEFIVPNGVTFRGMQEPGREQRHFLASTDLWFRPIHSRVGPDGAMYLVDFYNQVAIHNDTRGPAHGARNAAVRPDRDHHFTRLWRIQHRQAATLPPWRLADAGPADLARHLEHPNGWVRGTAARLLRERGPGPATDALRALAAGRAAAPARITALGVLDAAGELDGETLLAAIVAEDSAVRRAALRLAAERDNSAHTPDPNGVTALLNDPDPRVRLNALLAISTTNVDDAVAAAVLAAWPAFQDRHLQSAALGVAVAAPFAFLDAAFAAADPAPLADFVGHLARLVATKRDAALAARFATAVARAPAAKDALKQSALEALARALPADVKPAWSPALQSAFAALLQSPRAGVPGAALPLIVRWGGDAALAAELRPVAAQLVRALGDAALPDADRAQVAVNLLGVRQLDPAILPAVTGLLGGGGASPALQRRVIEALGNIGDLPAAAALIAAFPRLPGELHDLAFGTLAKRPEWAAALVQALADRQIGLADLGPANVHRLRTHADKAVAEKAAQVVEALRGPEQKEKDALVAQFLPAVQRPGSAARGRELFTANCAGCHRYKGEGADFAPDLTGMGAHGAHDLLLHILDPNRVVEPNFISVSIETKDDLTYDGIVLRENNAVVVLRNQTAEYEIRKDNIQSRQSTGRSLMPEGFEALGEEGMRDLLTYLMEDDVRFRILDLSGVFNTSSAEGIYANRESRGETVRLFKFGTIKVEDVPFDVLSPQKSPTGLNLLTLRGRLGLTPQYVQRVEIPVGVAANRLHFLSGIGGWAYPWDGENQKDKPVLKATVHFAGGATEELVFRNGVEFADYIGSGDNFNVPGSKPVPGLVRSGQVRYFARDLRRRDGVIEKIVLESFNNEVAPTVVGLTVEQAPGPATLTGPAPAAAAAPAVAPVRWGEGLKTLLIGGGSHHDYGRWFNLADVALLNAAGGLTAAYRETGDLTADIIRGADVLVISANKAFPDPAVRAAIMAHAGAGKGLVLLHPGLWYNWADWPEYNRVLAGGGSRGHDRYGEFEVVTTGAAHPLLRDVPAKFSITDELYWFEPDPAGTPLEVLATAHSKEKQKAYPQVFVVKHPRARIAGITLGHDGAAHSHPAYQQLLKNAVKWAGSAQAFTGTDR